MKVIALTLVALMAIVCAAAASMTPAELKNADVKALFESFMAKHNKVYATNPQEVAKRFKIFEQNVQNAVYRNKQSSGETYGVSPFMDLSPEEFRSRYLSKAYTRAQLKQKMGAVEADFEIKNLKDAPGAYDWRDHGAVTPVKNQGMCGSCWAFSTVANVEGLYFLKTQNLKSFSEQQLVDCDHQCEPDNPKSCDAGCNGGLMDNALRYVQENGLELESDYGYQAVDMKCKYDASKVVTKVANSTILPNDADKIKSFLVSNGPLAVALNAEWLQTYTGGISAPWTCSPKALDHGVTIVGYGTGKNWFGSTVDYWIVKNSWSASWGEKGYFRIKRGSNVCGIESYVCSGVEAIPVSN